MTEELIIQQIQEFQIYGRDTTQRKDKVPKVSGNEPEYVDGQFDDLLKSGKSPTRYGWERRRTVCLFIA